MSLQAVARLGDSAAGFCSAHGGGGTNWTGTITAVSGVFIIGGVQAATVDDTGTCSCGHVFKISAGSAITTAPNGKKVARTGDPVIVYNGVNPVGSGYISTGASICVSE